MRLIPDIAKKYAFLLIIISFFAISLYRLRDIPPPWADEMAHMNSAWHLAVDGKLWCDFYDTDQNTGGLFISMPVQWYLLAAWIKVFGMDYAGLRMLYLILSCGTLLALYILTKKLFGLRVSLLAIFLLAFSYIFFNVSRQLLPQVPTSLFSVLAILLFYMASGRRSFVLFFCTGILSGLAVLSHPLGIASVPAIIALSLAYKTSGRFILGYLLGLALFPGIYGVHAISHIDEYIRQSRFALDSYPQQNIFLNIADEFLVRYCGLIPAGGWFVPYEGGNYFLYAVKRFFLNADLRIYFCEIVPRILYLVSVMYLLFKRFRELPYKGIVIVTVIYMGVLSVHPNKFGPYLFVVIPFLTVCFALFVKDHFALPVEPSRKGRYLKRMLAISVVSIFILSNMAQIYNFLTTKKVPSYSKFFEKVAVYIPKGATVTGLEYYWLGMYRYCNFIPAQRIICAIENEMLSRSDKVQFRDLPDNERINIIKKYFSMYKIDYALITWHNWEKFTYTGDLYTDGVYKEITSYLFNDSKKIADFMRETYYRDTPEPVSYMDEMRQCFAPEGFTNVSEEYQKGLKVYKLK